MSPETVIYKLQRALEAQLTNLTNVITTGVDSMENYKYILGQINALESVRKELSSLLNSEEKMKEQSSTLETTNPKIVLPNKDLVGVKKLEPKKEVTKEETKLPKPTGWRMLVLPFRMDEKTKGGILLGGETIDRQQVASQCGNVLAMGDACYVDKERYPNGPWCKVGDWVVFARYAGSRIEIDGGEVRLLNEDEVLATVEDPTDILHKY